MVQRCSSMVSRRWTRWNTIESPLRHWSPRLFIGRDLMVSFKSRYISESLWGQTTLMLVILAIVLAVLRLSVS
jgi:hypothetical protein